MQIYVILPDLLYVTIVMKFSQVEFTFPACVYWVVDHWFFYYLWSEMFSKCVRQSSLVNPVVIIAYFLGRFWTLISLAIFTASQRDLLLFGSDFTPYWAFLYLVIIIYNLFVQCFNSEFDLDIFILVEFLE